MILEDSELDARLVSEDNLINILSRRREDEPKDNSNVEIRPMRKEQTTGDKVPDLVKNLLANLAHNTDDTDKEIAEVFGVDKSTVSKYAKGLVGQKVNTDLLKTIDTAGKNLEEKKSIAHDMALDGLIDSLTLLKPSLCAHGSDLKPSSITKIASDLAKVSKQLTKEEADSVVNNTQVILYKPTTRAEESYETIDV